MVHPNVKFLRAIGTLIGGMVGVGVFGLPYAFAQSGYIIGALVFVVLAALISILMMMYGELVSRAHDHHRLVGHVKNYLGPRWGWVTAVTHTVGLWGAMLAYIIVGGHFLYLLFGSVFGGPEVVYSLIMAVAASALIYRGLKFVASLEVFVISALIFLFLVVIILGLGHLRVDHLLSIHPGNIFVPYGVILFAFGGLGVIPEMKELLSRQPKRLPQALIIGLIVTGVLYLLFSFAVVGTTGPATTSMALTGLIPIFGSGFGLVAALLGSLTILSIFTILGIELLNMLKYDFRLEHRRAWAMAVVVPLLLFIMGLREFIDLISFIGSVFGATLGIIVVLAYEKMKQQAGRSYRGLNIPTPVSVVIIIIFVFGAFLEIGSRLN
ncbi:amino acid permease [Patescibacteria group bacterium]|nr:amino acid permease [Patescibacteria group bacterium]MBU1705914.1 amino acid permease [Patescibacteria group bacterium]